METKAVKILNFIIATIILINVFTINSKAETIKNINDKSEVESAITELIITINVNGMSKTQITNIINLYKEVTKVYTNFEIAEMINNNKEVLINNGSKEEDLNSITGVLTSTNETQLNAILNKINVDELVNQIANGADTQTIIRQITSNLSATEKVGLLVNILFATNVMKKVLIVLGIIFIYRTLLRCVIYKKANKPAWAPFVPIYRNVVMMQICGISPWWLLLLLVPVVGWIILALISVASKFLLAEGFGKGVIFSFGLWIFAPVFETILVVSRKTKYIGFEE